MRKDILQFAKYVTVGAAATGVDYGSYVLLTRLGSLGSLTANPLAYWVGNIVSFVGHRTVTFRSHGNPLAEYGRFICVTVIGLSVSQLVVWACLGLGIYDLFAKAAAVLVSGLFNYTVNRFWTFRSAKRAF